MRAQFLVVTLVVYLLVLIVVTGASRQLAPQAYYSELGPASSITTLVIIRIGTTATTPLVRPFKSAPVESLEKQLGLESQSFLDIRQCSFLLR